MMKSAGFIYLMSDSVFFGDGFIYMSWRTRRKWLVPSKEKWIRLEKKWIHQLPKWITPIKIWIRHERCGGFGFWDGGFIHYMMSHPICEMNPPWQILNPPAVLTNPPPKNMNPSHNIRGNPFFGARFIFFDDGKTIWTLYTVCTL